MPQSLQLSAVDEERIIRVLTPQFPKRMRVNVVRTSEAENDASPPALLDLAELSWGAFLAALVATIKGGSGHQQLLQVRQCFDSPFVLVIIFMLVTCESHASHMRVTGSEAECCCAGWHATRTADGEWRAAQ